TAVDTFDPAPSFDCTPTSGGQFSIGTSTVTCTATDDTGNAATASFDVHVESASEQVVDLAGAVRDASLPHGVETALLAKLSPHRSCAQLAAFETLVANAERVGHISTTDADAWIADAQRIAAVEGCDGS